MPAKVADASALAALLFAEPEAERVAMLLDGAVLIAPALIEYELTNVCLIKMRRHPESRAALQAAFQMRGRLAVEHVAVDHGGVLELAVVAGLTAYDASYLWLAKDRGIELVTLDRRLAAAAGRLAAR